MIMHLDMYFINEYMQYLKKSWLQLAEIIIGLHFIVLSRHQYLHEGFLRVQLFRLQYGDQSNKLEHTCTTCKIVKRTCAFFTPSHIHIYTCQLLKVHLFLFLHSYMYKHWDTQYIKYVRSADYISTESIYPLYSNEVHVHKL